MPARPVVSAIVVNRDRAGLLDRCLASLAGQVAEIVVVDNASSDGSRELVAERHSAVRLVALQVNHGFGTAVNTALRGVAGDWVLLLNNDARLQPGAVTALLDAGGAEPEVWAVAAQLRFAGRPGVVNSTGLVVDRLGIAADRGLGTPAHDDGAPVDVFGPSAGCALYRRAALEALGGFDERFFVYLEDVDLAWRARMRGWRTRYAPAAVAYHEHAATAVHNSPAKHYWVGRNRVRLLAKHADGALLRRYGAAIVAYDLAYIAYAAAADRTLAPLRGRLAGLREWRVLRREHAAERRPVDLAPPIGLRVALRRRRAWVQT